MWLRLIFGPLAWALLAVLGLGDGIGARMFSLDLIAIHVRFLVAVPLVLWGEERVAERMAGFVDYILRSGIVPESSIPELSALVSRVNSLKKSTMAEVCFLLIAYALPMLEAFSRLPGRTSNWTSIAGAGMSGFVYLRVYLPLFRFLLLRALWQLGLWCYLIFRIERLPLNLVSTHPDGAAGLGYLSLVHEYFVPFAGAISAVLTAQFAEDMSSGVRTFESAYLLVGTIVLVTVILFLGPLALFSKKLVTCRTAGMSSYMRLATEYVNAFESKWIRDRDPSNSVLGTSDLQSLADLTNSVNVVRRMRTVPFDSQLMMKLMASVVFPLLFLLLFKYSFNEIVRLALQLVTGM